MLSSEGTLPRRFQVDDAGLFLIQGNFSVPTGRHQLSQEIKGSVHFSGAGAWLIIADSSLSEPQILNSKWQTPLLEFSNFPLNFPSQAPIICSQCFLPGSHRELTRLQRINGFSSPEFKFLLKILPKTHGQVCYSNPPQS